MAYPLTYRSFYRSQSVPGPGAVSAGRAPLIDHRPTPPGAPIMRSDYHGAMTEPTTPHPATIDPQQLVDDCKVQRTRGSGPGGQHRNKVETAIVIAHNPTGVTGAASERRQQAQNQKVALFRLRVNLALELRCTIDLDAEPSALWRSRCRAGKIAINPEHDDFPAVLAEVLDTVAAFDTDVKAAAERLGCSTTQLVNLLKVDRRALGQVNQTRQRGGLRPLR